MATARDLETELSAIRRMPKPSRGAAIARIFRRAINPRDKDQQWQSILLFALTGMVVRFKLGARRA